MDQHRVLATEHLHLPFWNPGSEAQPCGVRIVRQASPSLTLHFGTYSTTQAEIATTPEAAIELAHAILRAAGACTGGERDHVLGADAEWRDDRTQTDRGTAGEAGYVGCAVCVAHREKTAKEAAL